jgi:hypothetical protein
MYVPTYFDLVRWPDSTLLAWREEAKSELDRNSRDESLQRVYDASTQEVANRTQASWGPFPTTKRVS